jgi:hypothetical protein
MKQAIAAENKHNRACNRKHAVDQPIFTQTNETAVSSPIFRVRSQP